MSKFNWDNQFSDTPLLKGFKNKKYSDSLRRKNKVMDKGIFNWPQSYLKQSHVQCKPGGQKHPPGVQRKGEQS